MTHAADAAGLAFECQPECGYCCAVSPLVLPHEAKPLRVLVVDGRIPIRGSACSALGADRRCTVYDARPTACRLYPFSVHAGRRVQVTVTLACPGVAEGEGAQAQAEAAASLALAQPGAKEMAAQAKATFAEYDRRMKEWGVEALPDKLRSAWLPHADRLARPETLPTLFAALAEGDLVLQGKDPVGRALETEPDATVDDLLDEAGPDAFGTGRDALWVEPGHAWTTPRFADGRVEMVRLAKDGATSRASLAVHDLVTRWDDDAAGALADYLRRLMHRDRTEGAAAWLVDQSGYQATPASAFGRVLGESALQVVLRAGAFAAEAGRGEVDAALAWRGVRAYETSYHSLPTIGAVL